MYNYAHTRVLFYFIFSNITLTHKMLQPETILERIYTEHAKPFGNVEMLEYVTLYVLTYFIRRLCLSLSLNVIKAKSRHSCVQTIPSALINLA